MSPTADSTIRSTIALLDQFISSVDSLRSAQEPQSTNSQPTEHPSPLYLLTASSTSLKSTVTKLSLLAITTPFTPSAIISTLHSLNTSILPSLTTAALLTSPTIYPESFSRECRTLALSTLRDLKALLHLVKARSDDGQPKKEIPEAQKKNITEVTGKVWEDCDLIVSFGKGDVVGFICKKATQWLDLMKDAVKELEEWDPEEDDGEDPFGLDELQSDEDAPEEGTNRNNKDADRAVMSAGVKDQALKMLRRIPQSIHVVVKQRLEKLPRATVSDVNAAVVPMPAAQRKTVNKILKRTRKISECIDESAEAMYMGNPEQCFKKAGEARALTIEVVEAVANPWTPSEQESKEDQYIKRALVWIQQVEPGNTQTQVPICKIGT